MLGGVGRTIDLIREEDIRRAGYLLSPPSLRIGLEAALDFLAGGFEDFFRVDLRLTEPVRDIDVAANGLNPDLRLVVYRVVEEDGGQRILNEQYNGKGALYGTDHTDIHHGHPAGNGKLGKIPARLAQGGSGSA